MKNFDFRFSFDPGSKIQKQVALKVAVASFLRSFQAQKKIIINKGRTKTIEESGNSYLIIDSDFTPG